MRGVSPSPLRHGLLRLLAGLSALAIAPSADVSAQQSRSVDGPEDELSVRLPVRLTAGSEDHLMGVADADRHALYFIGDEHGTNEIFVQSPLSAGPRRLFDALGDHAFPRISPDGCRLAYISYVRDATGDACVRDLPEGSERCLTDADTAELEVIWLDHGTELGVLSRSALHSGFTLTRHPVDGGASRELLERDMIGLARSPDGAYLAYVAIEPRRSNVGVTFASRVGQGLRVQRMGANGPDGSSIVFAPELPGLSGFPAFSLDGRYLYFSQYLNDTNRDGIIDGGDNSVIVRVGFDPSRSDPFEGQRIEQLTSSRWNCHYPSPTADALLMTCSHGGSLDIYSLPLDGVVPSDWTVERLRAELGVSRDLWAKLLIASRLSSHLSAGDGRFAVEQEIVWLHLGLREYESAIYYADRIVAESGPDSARARWARLFAELAKHRRADLALARGQLSRAYVESERRRLDDVRRISTQADGSSTPTEADLAALGRWVASEILDDLGEKTEALAELRAVDVGSLHDRFVLHLAGERAAALYGALADRTAVLAMQASLASHPAFTLGERLGHASDYVDELLRGRGAAARAAAIATARTAAADGSELALLLDVESALAVLTDADQEDVRARIFALYTAETDRERKRAIALRTVRAASRRGNEFLQYQFATTWASSVAPDDPQRRYAEELYRAIVVERAYGELDQGEIREAAGYFFQASRNAESLDAHIGFIEARARQGNEDLRAFYDQRFARTPDDPGYLFARAYLDARDLASITDPERHAATVRAIVERLERVDAAWPRRVEVHHLFGYALHRAAMVGRSREDAGAANNHYLLALDLADDRPRARAAILSSVGMLQASLGNHRRALEHFERRAHLPFVTTISELSFELARSRSHFHAREPGRARECAERALALVDRDPALARYRPLVLDRLAFASHEDGAYDAAARRYEELLGLLRGDEDAPINRLKAELGLASSSLYAGHADAAVASLDRADAVLAAHPDLAARGEPSLTERYVYDRDHYAALLAGLRAEAEIALGHADRAAAALAIRARSLEAFYERSESDDDLAALAQLRLRQAEVERMRGDLGAAQRFAEDGLAKSALFNERTGSGVTQQSLGLLALYAELHLFAGIPRQELHRDVEAELRAAYEFMVRFPSPRWTSARIRSEIYLSLLGSEASETQPPRGNRP